MTSYKNEGFYLKNFTDIQDVPDIKLPKFASSRENLVRAFALAKDTRIEDTYSSQTEENTIKAQQMGQRFTDLLRLLRHENISKEREDAVCDMIQQVALHNHSDFPAGINPLKQRSEGKPWAQDAFDYLYYMAMRKLSEQKLPDIDYQDKKQLAECAAEQNAYSSILLDLVQFSDGDYEEKLAKKYTDFKQLKEKLTVAGLLERAIGNLSSSEVLLPHLTARIVADQFQDQMAGNSRICAAEGIDLEQLVSLKEQVKEFLDSIDGKEKQLNDYLQRKPNAACPLMLHNKKWCISPMYDTKTPKLDFETIKDCSMQDPQQRALLFDELFNPFPDAPAHYVEPAYKRIYIDGKNAYDLYKDQFQGSEAEIAQAVKAKILNVLEAGNSRVEFARIVQQLDGHETAVVVPVRADLKALDIHKKWYQPSMVKQEEQLWSKDPDAAVRQTSIAQQAESRQDGQFYQYLLDSVDAVYQKYTPDSERLKARAEALKIQKIYAFMNAARKRERAEQFLLKQEDAHYKKLAEQNKIPTSRSTASETFSLADACCEEIMENLVKEIQTGLHIGIADSVCRNRLMAFRQIMESIGMEQNDVDAYAEKLEPEQKAAFESFRSWEKKLVSQEDHEPIQLPDGIANIQTAAGFLTNIYKNIYYDKFGYVNHFNPDFMDTLVHTIKIPKEAKLSFDALMEKTKAPAALSSITKKPELSSPNKEHTHTAKHS